VLSGVSHRRWVGVDIAIAGSLLLLCLVSLRGCHSMRCTLAGVLGTIGGGYSMGCGG
jgi:hypothetical protein